MQLQTRLTVSRSTDSAVRASASQVTAADDPSVTADILPVTELQLTTQHRFTGRAESDTLAYRRQGNDFVVVARNNDARFKPDWFLNLREEPIVELNVGDARFFAKADLPTGKVRLALMPLVMEMVDNHTHSIPRNLSIVLLRPMC